MFSPYALHFSGDSDHKPVVLFALERERPDGIVWGGAVFSNSFGQPSVYAFGGQRLYRWSPWDALYAEWNLIGVPSDPATGSRLQPPVDTEYGLRELALVDPSGNLLRAGSPVS